MVRSSSYGRTTLHFGGYVGGQVNRLLEILAVFRYVLKHQSGICHGNADELSRQTCKDCWHCASIQQRDGGPLQKELEREQEPLAMWVLTSCLDKTPALDGAGSTLGNVTYPGARLATPTRLLPNCGEIEYGCRKFP